MNLFFFQPWADELAGMIAQCMKKHRNPISIIVALESTTVYSIHIANFLSTNEILMPFKPYVFCVNPKATSNYRKPYIEMKKTDPTDAFLIADFARVGRTKKLELWRRAGIHAYQKEIKLIEQAIEKYINGMNPDALAKYTVLYWPKGDSGDFTSEDNKMSKARNPYLRYYLGEAANSVRKHIPEYADFYVRKYAEVTKHQHKKSLAQQHIRIFGKEGDGFLLLTKRLSNGRFCWPGSEEELRKLSPKQYRNLMEGLEIEVRIKETQL